MVVTDTFWRSNIFGVEEEECGFFSYELLCRNFLYRRLTCIHFVNQTALTSEEPQICGSFMSDIGCCPQSFQVHNFEGNVLQPIGRYYFSNVVSWILKI